jgi:hypothetical protein
MRLFSFWPQASDVGKTHRFSPTTVQEAGLALEPVCARWMREHSLLLPRMEPPSSTLHIVTHISMICVVCTVLTGSRWKCVCYGHAWICLGICMRCKSSGHKEYHGNLDNASDDACLCVCCICYFTIFIEDILLFEHFSDVLPKIYHTHTHTEKRKSSICPLNEVPLNIEVNEAFLW